MRCRRCAGAVLAPMLSLAAPLCAQSTTLTVSSTTLTYVSPVVADYTAGFICAGSVTVTATAAATSRRDSLFVRLTSAAAIPSNVAGVTKALADYQWNTNAAGCTATTGWAAVPGQTSAPALLGFMTYVNTSFNRQVFFRLLLNWATDRGGATYTLPNLRFFVNRPTAIPAPP